MKQSKLPQVLPEGLVFHCEKCNLVVPVEAPRPDDPNCEFVALHKLSWFNPKETPAGQFAMATAAWALIHHNALSPEFADPESVEYRRAFQKERKVHYKASAMYKGLTPDQLEAGRAHRRDRELYK